MLRSRSGHLIPHSKGYWVSVTKVGGKFVHYRRPFCISGQRPARTQPRASRFGDALGTSEKEPQPEGLRASERAICGSWLAVLQTAFGFDGYPGRRRKASLPWAKFSQAVGLKAEHRPSVGKFSSCLSQLRLRFVEDHFRGGRTHTGHADGTHFQQLFVGSHAAGGFDLDVGRGMLPH